jgi:hypothetical protein
MAKPALRARLLDVNGAERAMPRRLAVLSSLLVAGSLLVGPAEARKCARDAAAVGDAYVDTYEASVWAIAPGPLRGVDRGVTPSVARGAGSLTAGAAAWAATSARLFHGQGLRVQMNPLCRVEGESTQS